MNKLIKYFRKIKRVLSKIISYRYHTRHIKGLMSTCETLKILTSDQKKEIQDYYQKNYCKKLPDFLWHQYYYTLNNIFSPKYVPNYILAEINDALYDKTISKAYDDKNLYYTLFPDMLQAKAYINCINGYYYSNGLHLSLDEALNKASNLGDVIIKPTYCSCNGDGVKHLHFNNGIDTRSGKSIKNIFVYYGKNFVIQEVIKQHHDLAALNPSSVNTIRMVTYRRVEEVALVYAVMRIGKFGSKVDNTSAGGMTCKIDENGKLSKYAISSKPAGRFEKNEAGLVFENYQVPFFDEVFNQAQIMHFRMPYFIMIGWDFSINENNEVVFIEMNAPFGLHQPTAGPGFGKYTDEIFNLCFHKG